MTDAFEFSSPGLINTRPLWEKPPGKKNYNQTTVQSACDNTPNSCCLKFFTEHVYCRDYIRWRSGEGAAGTQSKLRSFQLG